MGHGIDRDFEHKVFRPAPPPQSQGGGLGMNSRAESGRTGADLPMPTGVRVGLDTRQWKVQLPEPAVQAARRERSASGI
jgi:hypothetical protein